MMDEKTASESSPRRIFGVTRNVFALGLTSFFNDLSSEVALKTIPFLLKNLLGAPILFIGLIEGAAESTSTLLKMASGWLSDKLGRRKPLALAGYGLAALTRPLLFLAHWMASGGFVFFIRVTDRVGKGIRGAPRDALLADSCSIADRGRSFGLQRAMDQLGSFAGYALAALVCWLSLRTATRLDWNTYWWLVLLSVVPAACAVTVLWVMVTEPKRPTPPPAATNSRDEAGAAVRAKPLGRTFWLFLVIIVFFTLGNSADALLLIKAQDLAVPLFAIFLVYGGSSALSSILSIPAGQLSDRIGRKALIIAGWALYALVYLAFSLSPGPWAASALLIIYGAYYGLSEGVAKAIVADLVPVERRGTAYGLYNGAIGIGALPASLIAAAMWKINIADRFHLPFLFGAVMAGLAVVLLVFLPLRKPVDPIRRPTQNTG